MIEAAMEGPDRSPAPGPANDTKKPPVILTIGMAGSGKTTFIQQLAHQTLKRKQTPYLMNLDPAVYKIPYSANIDIRDTVNYKEVMKQFSLGPNGGIMTSLNLFATRFDQVMKIVEERAAGSNVDYFLVDTPGQIEIFTWSASGAIITETLASSLPSVVVYVVDTVRTSTPSTFMSNMLYACSIMYKTKLPFIIAFNKTDIVSHKFAEEWMTDFEAFQDSLDADKTYMGNLSRSMSLVLDEFYSCLKTVGVSSVTGEGFDDLFVKIDEAVREYEEHYVPVLERNKKDKKERDDKAREETLNKLRTDFSAKTTL